MGWEESKEYRIIRTSPDDAQRYARAADDLGTVSVKVTEPMHPDISPELEGTVIVGISATESERQVLTGYVQLLEITEELK